MAKREPSTRSVMTTSPPPTYSVGGAGEGRPQHAQLASFSSSTSGSASAFNPYDPYATTNGQRRAPTDSTVVDLSTAGSHFAPSTSGVTATETMNDNASIAQYSMAGSTAASDFRPEIMGPTRAGERNITNFIDIVRKATPHNRFFSLFYPNPKIIQTFHIDPHLRVPGGVLDAVKSSASRSNLHGAATGPTTHRRAEQRRERNAKNLALSLEDGRMDATIHLIADCDPSSSSSRRLRSKASLTMERGFLQRKTTLQRTTITATLNTTRPKTFKAYPMLLRVSAPEPRPPFFLSASCTGSNSSISRSPVTLFLPQSFHGPFTIKIQVGNIDHHLWISPSVAVKARMMSEDAQSRGYFLGPLPDVLDEEDEDELEGDFDAQALSQTATVGARLREDEEWPGDKVEIDIGNGRLRILYEDEVLEGMAAVSSNGWIWPAKWG